MWRGTGVSPVRRRAILALESIGTAKMAVRRMAETAMPQFAGTTQPPRERSTEVSEGIVLDYDAEGNIVGIDIDNASRKVDLKEVSLNKLPAEVEKLTA